MPSVKVDEFFDNEIDNTLTSINAEPWDDPVYRRWFKDELMTDLRRGPLPDRSDVEVGLALTQLVQDEFTAYGTDAAGQQLSESEVEAAVIALRAVTRRLGIEFEPPFRNFTGFRTYWMANDGYRNWQARRVMVGKVFDPLYMSLLRLEETMLEALFDPVSPRAEVGWPAVDEEIRELRRRFQNATTAQDHKDVGLRCVTVTELLGDVVYDPAKHDQEGERPAPRGNTKDRFERYIRTVLVGRDNAATRSLARAIVVFAQGVKHSTTPTRREAGIAADSVIMLTNLLRRLEQRI